MFAIKKVLFLCMMSMCSISTGASAMPVDFDGSLGSGDSYMGKFYSKLQKKLIKTSRSWFQHIKSFKGQPALNAWRSQFEKHETEICPKGRIEPKIPKIIHQIWIGPSPLPEKYKAWQSTWQSLEGWSYKLWTDKEVQDFPLINSSLYYKEKNYGARADILRVEILNKEGGVYVDMDFEYLKPGALEELNNRYDFYCGITPLDCKGLLLNNALIGTIPQHPILQGIIKKLPRLTHKIENTNVSWSDAILSKGPGLLTKIFLKHANKGTCDIALPPTFFYPLGVYQIGKINSCDAITETDIDFFASIKEKVTKPETIAIHWWDGSWALPAANALN